MSNFLHLIILKREKSKPPSVISGEVMKTKSGFASGVSRSYIHLYFKDGTGFDIYLDEIHEIIQDDHDIIAHARRIVGTPVKRCVKCNEDKVMESKYCNVCGDGLVIQDVYSITPINGEDKIDCTDCKHYRTPNSCNVYMDRALSTMKNCRFFIKI